MLDRFRDLVYGALRWIAGHVRGFHAAVGIFLTLGFGLALAALGLFALVAEWMAGGVTQRFDEAVVRWAHGLSTPWLDALALVGAALGAKLATWIVLGLGTLFLWRSRHLYSLLLLWVSLLGGYVLNQVLKGAFARPRPDLVVGDLHLLGMTFSFPQSPSFPSGHAITSVVVFGTLAYLVARREPTPRMRRLTLAGAGLLILLIGLSRIYLGVHYPSDVLAGYLAGFIWATFCAFGIEAVRYFRGRKPGVAREEEDLEEGMHPVDEAVRGEESS